DPGIGLRRLAQERDHVVGRAEERTTPARSAESARPAGSARPALAQERGILLTGDEAVLVRVDLIEPVAEEPRGLVPAQLAVLVPRGLPEGAAPGGGPAGTFPFQGAISSTSVDPRAGRSRGAPQMSSFGHEPPLASGLVCSTGTGPAGLGWPL